MDSPNATGNVTPTARSARFRWAVRSLQIALGLLLAGILVYRGLRESPTPTRVPLVTRQIQPFQLTDAQGHTVTERDLAGHYWVANFIFTRCGGPCPLVTRQMRQVVQRVTSPHVRFVSITVDPQYDTPVVLAAYAKEMKAEDPRWSFLTGDPADIRRVVQESFLMALQDNPNATFNDAITHSLRVVLVNPQGQWESVYEGDQTSSMKKLVQRLQDIPS